MTRRLVTPATLLLGAVLSFVFLQFAVGAILVVGMGVDPRSGEPTPVDVGLTAQGFGTVVTLLVLAWVVRRLRRAGFTFGIDLRGRRGIGFHLVGAYVLVLAVWVPLFMFVYPVVWTNLGLELTPQPHLEYFVDPTFDLRFWIMLATICLLGPIIEEVVFRGFLQTALARWVGDWSALISTSLLFGLVHGVSYALPLAVMGGFFGYLRMRDQGMMAPMFAHCLHNSVTIGVTIFWPEMFSEVYGG